VGYFRKFLQKKLQKINKSPIGRKLAQSGRPAPESFVWGNARTGSSHKKVEKSGPKK
jgi:hypothetical protein